ncbi:asparagine synthase [Pontibacillus sp. HMF3514]|uniref:asparagine synthase n=1 Tax=Pontibacillus sp. HMF3514 TaxID=2692425 RepID=UPI00132044DA|nr:asparagine synthase [Pontibacillus sp. HMF3514]QHE51224.1 asparagine synthase [Pontibacillus sp. HMF3514]
MNIREGIIPVVLGTAVTAAAYCLESRRSRQERYADALVGFGLAHIVLGAIDLIEHRR